MKVENLFGLILLFVSICSITSCDDKNENVQEATPFHLKKHYYEVALRGNNNIPIVNGSGDVNVFVEDEEIVSATYNGELFADQQKGVILVEGKSKGETTIKITDNITRESETVSIKITDSYVACHITESNHPFLKIGITLFLINNEARNFYAFQMNDMHHTLYEKPYGYGAYSLCVEKTTKDSKAEFIPYLTLTYTSDENGSYITGEIPQTDHKFNILHPSQFVYRVFESKLGVNWDNMVENATRSNYPDNILQMQEESMGYSIIGELDTDYNIPENILN